LRDLELSKEVVRALRLATLVTWFFAAMTWSAAMISARLSRGMMFTSAYSNNSTFPVRNQPPSLNAASFRISGAA
jgi:hypothetical protein